MLSVEAIADGRGRGGRGRACFASLRRVATCTNISQTPPSPQNSPSCKDQPKVKKPPEPKVQQATEPPEIQQERLQVGWKRFVRVEVERRFESARRTGTEDFPPRLLSQNGMHPEAMPLAADRQLEGTKLNPLRLAYDPPCSLYIGDIHAKS